MLRKIRLPRQKLARLSSSTSGRQNPGGMLYKQPVLPFLPPPLPISALATASASRTADSILLQSFEQMPFLYACLASGNLRRAEQLLPQIKEGVLGKSFTDEKRPFSMTKVSAAEDDAIWRVLPPRVHSEFLRLYWFHAIEEFKNLSVDANVYVQKAWSYFNQLAEDETWIKTENGVSTNMAIDSSILAVMMKGITMLERVAAEKNVSAAHILTRHVPVTALLPHIEALKISLFSILIDSIFQQTDPFRLGAVTPLEALDKLEREGRNRQGWNSWEEVIKLIRTRLSNPVQEAPAPELTPHKRIEKDSEDSAANVSLETLQNSLHALKFDVPGQAMDRQRLLEESTYDASRQLYIHELEELTKVGRDVDQGLQKNWLQGQMHQWHGLLTEKLKKDWEVMRGKYSMELEPYMKALTSEKMALITIVELIKMCGGTGAIADGVKTVSAVSDVGRAIEQEIHVEFLKKGTRGNVFLKELERQIQRGGAISPDGQIESVSKDRVLEMMWYREMKKKQEIEEKDHSESIPDWTHTIRCKVGGVLIQALMEVATIERSVVVNGSKITETQPAFARSYQYVRGQRLGTIRVNPALLERLDKDPMRMTLTPRVLPMIVPPKPWESWNRGSYLIHESTIMRTKQSPEQIQYLKQAAFGGSLQNVYDGLNVLGSVAWKINQPVFEVLAKVWNDGEEFADIPKKEDPEKPVQVERPDNLDTDPRARETFRARVRTVMQQLRANHSVRCDINYKLEIAKAFYAETFYFPHNLDFRGRAYPIPPNFSHVGNDLCRGLLKFAEKKPLGERGLRWLKIHLSNICGHDKVNFDEREQWTMERLDEVFDSADKPLEGKRWWLKSDDPWQCLATCIELTNALRSPNPLEFMSNLPIHQDGTCNGLQHYAALGGDLKGASQVNLSESERPSDVYSGVAEMTNQVVDRDAAAGHQYAQMLQGKITRKVVKQTVMTTVYGVTFIGAKRQIEKQLRDRGDIPPEHLYSASIYLGQIVLDSIGDVFKGAASIQTWLSQCARLISKSIPPARVEAAKQEGKSKEEKAESSRLLKEQMTSVIWTTPLGLPVVQPYRKPKKKQIVTALQTVFIHDPTLPAEVDSRAQTTGFPPNFIHSLDATHMMLTALACKDKIAFASVHDSYWTHASTVDQMSVTLRDAFIELHSQDILGKLREEFLERYKGHMVPIRMTGLSEKQEDASFNLDELRSRPGKFQAAGTPSDSPDEFEGSAPESEGRDVESQETEEAEGELTTKKMAKKVEDGAVDLSFGDDESEAKPKSKSQLAKEAAAARKAERMNKKIEKAKQDALITSGPRMKTKGRTSNKFVPLEELIPPVPPKGDFDLRRIRDSLYFFS